MTWIKGDLVEIEMGEERYDTTIRITNVGQYKRRTWNIGRIEKARRKCERGQNLGQR